MTPSIAQFLASELRIALDVDSDWLDAKNLAALAAVDRTTLAKTIIAGTARDDELGVALVRVALAAIDLATECDLDEDDIVFLSRLGARMRPTVAWARKLFDAGALDALDDFARLDPAPAGAGESLARLVPDLVRELGSARGAAAAGVIETIARRHREHARFDDAVPALVALMRDRDARSAAIDALGAIGDPRATDGLIAVIRDDTVSTYDKAWHLPDALRALHATAAAPDLVRLFERAEDATQRSHCVRALATLDPGLAAPVVARLWDATVANKFVIDICEAGAAANDAASLAFLERAAATKSILRGEAIAALARVKGPAAFEELCRAAVDDDDLVRASAIAPLCALRDPRAFAPLAFAVELGTPSAARALHELGDTRAIPVLVAALAKDRGYYQMDVMIKEALIEALGDFGLDQDGAWQGLVARLLDRSDHVQECAAIACQQLRPGSSEGASLVARKMDRIPNVPQLVARNTSPLLARLDGVARRGEPRDRDAARVILAAMRRLAVALATHEIRPAIDAVVASWSSWLGVDSVA